MRKKAMNYVSQDKQELSTEKVELGNMTALQGVF